VLALNKKHEVNPTEDAEFEELVAEDNKRKEYLEQVGFESNEIHLSEETGKSSEKCADLILSAVNAFQLDLVVTGATIGKFSFNNSHFLSLRSIKLSYCNCQTIHFSRRPSSKVLVSETGQDVSLQR
jgi:hypothetical protein